MYNPRNIREAYESLDVLANQRTAPTPISDDEYYPAVTELMCWLTEFELAERIAYAHPLNPAGAYERVEARHWWHVTPEEIGNAAIEACERTAHKVAFDAMMDVIEYAEAIS